MSSTQWQVSHGNPVVHKVGTQGKNSGKVKIRTRNGQGTTISAKKKTEKDPAVKR